MQEKNFYINIPNSIAAENWINNNKGKGIIQNIYGNEYIGAIFDPISETLILAFQIEISETKLIPIRATLEGLGADFSESAEEYNRKYPNRHKNVKDKLNL